MSDLRLRDLERRWQASGAVEDEGALLLERVRAGQLEHWTLIQMALLGNPGARFAESVSETDNFPRAREFLGNILQHDQDARATLAHYELVEEGDKAPPDTATALEALFEDLRSIPEHLEAINQMQKPVLQLIPIYSSYVSEGAGFQRMVNAINDHRRGYQSETRICDELQNRWDMNEEPTSKIVDWQIAVIEGAKVLPRESNRFLERDGVVQRLEDQLNQWKRYCREQSLQLCENDSYALLQMQEIRQAVQEIRRDIPPDQYGVDLEGWTILDDQRSTLIPVGRWSEDLVYFGVRDCDERDEFARFRVSVVVNNEI